MLNAWDFIVAAGLVLAGALGWRLKSLPLLGFGFALALAPLAAGLWNDALGSLLVERLGGGGLRPHQDEVAWWVIAAVSGLGLFALSLALSRMLAAAQLESLDRSFGAFLVVAMFLALVSLNMARLGAQCAGDIRRSLMRSWTWSHLRLAKEPVWLQRLERLELPQKP